MCDRCQSPAVDRDRQVPRGEFGHKYQIDGLRSKYGGVPGPR